VTKRTNEQWINDLQSIGPDHDKALSDLRLILVSGLRRGLLGQVNTTAPEFETLAEDFAQEALLKILDKLDTFAGRSQFTTWAHKIAVSVALTELRRKRWQDTSLDGLLDTEDGVYTSRLMADPTPDPEIALERAEMLARMNHLLSQGLTEKQYTALIAAVIQGKSPTEIARQMDMNPNAVYKLIFDARLRLKHRLATEGLTPAEVIAVFE
jgi:RNA polymerase sigma-70 factor (ECF subfamily)